MSQTNTLDKAGAVAHVAEIVYHGDKLILPDGMGIPSAIELLEARQHYLEQEVNINETFDVFPWDGANAIHEVLSKKYGWTNSVATPGFFGDTPPRLINIEIAPNVFKNVPWGSFSLPGVAGLLQTGVGQKDGRFVFALKASVLRKDEATIREIFTLVRTFLKSNSIYRGQAIKIRFTDDRGDNLDMPEPKFMDTSSISEDMVIYSDEIQDAIKVNLFTPIQRVQDCITNGIPVKRGVLLGGSYGTGKTLAATVASKLAVDNGITYLYIPRADELAKAIEFAKQYQSPACVIFCEDIDRVLDGERDVEMDDILNIIDGIDTKTSNIIVVLTTNNLDGINPAMLRPGRLDAVIEVTAPDAKAVQKLIRLYGKETIPADADLSKVGELLEGQIPAVIAEVVKRAKLSQLMLQKPGEPVSRITAEALILSSQSMAAQLKLLKDRIAAQEVKPSTFETAMKDLVRKATKQAQLEYENGETEDIDG